MRPNMMTSLESSDRGKKSAGTSARPAREALRARAIAIMVTATADGRKTASN
jgi:hypothetical protein